MFNKTYTNNISLLEENKVGTPKVSVHFKIFLLQQELKHQIVKKLAFQTACRI